MIPVSMPFSHWSNQRTASCRHSIPGLGYGSWGQACDHGPMIAFTGAFTFASIRGTLSR